MEKSWNCVFEFLWETCFIETIPFLLRIQVGQLSVTEKICINMYLVLVNHFRTRNNVRLCNCHDVTENY